MVFLNRQRLHVAAAFDVVVQVVGKRRRCSLTHQPCPCEPVSHHIVEGRYPAGRIGIDRFAADLSIQQILDSRLNGFGCSLGEFPKAQRLPLAVGVGELNFAGAVCCGG
ncbi:hypothetical protein [Adhaeretor mobilis]|uniref:hypothetical protein n=1 Tax=Adhaeretor mobilis TaxID=1930276 RepID=UPI001FE55937|nr:hypothetical protein [Adhaeretor mobilis]